MASLLQLRSKMLVFIAGQDGSFARQEAEQCFDAGLTPITFDAIGVGAPLAHYAEALAYCGAAIIQDHDDGSFLARLEAEATRLGIPVSSGGGTYRLDRTEERFPEASALFRETLGRMYRMFLAKNRDYSPANIGGMGELGLVTRLWDKTARLLSLTGFQIKAEFLGYEQPLAPKYESIDDTYQDLAVYAINGLILRAGKWGR